ncbi:hypothetical protein FT641_17830 [Bacillus paranthracis]|uniref:hypothetical protein n=1 Tax=Bacillus paranthracis TaxID=2026186 RepID=UPI00187AD5F7|nr:hypothetical protein [Bacillus paranthracis]MBE7114579.1 hypothetical protein [Bacillus paranthracis]MBE7154547.1 hypothetical protein [Bacillus paranthracis]
MTRKHDYKLIAYLYKAGYSQGDIAAVFGSVSGHISKVLKKEGVVARPRGQKVVPVPYEKFPDAVQKAVLEAGITARVQKVSEVRKGTGAAVKGGSNKEVKGNTGWSESKKKEAREYLMVYLYKAGYSVRAVEILTETKNGEKVLDKYQVSRRKEDVEDSKLTPYTDFPDKVKKIIDVLGLTDWIQKSTRLRITGEVQDVGETRQGEVGKTTSKSRTYYGLFSKEDEVELVKKVLIGWVESTALTNIDLGKITVKSTDRGLNAHVWSYSDAVCDRFTWVTGKNVFNYHKKEDIESKIVKEAGRLVFELEGAEAVSYLYGSGTSSYIDVKFCDVLRGTYKASEDIRKGLLKKYGKYSFKFEVSGVNGGVSATVKLIRRK